MTPTRVIPFPLLQQRKTHNTKSTMKLTTAFLTILSTLSLPAPTAAFAHPSFLSRTAVLPRHAPLTIRGGSATTAGETNEVISTVPTEPIADMRPGTSGLRKKVEVWQGEHYVENFIQCLIDTAVEKNGGKMLDT